MNWEQLQKDKEAAADLLGPAPHECAQARKRLSDSAPDLAALALAGKRLADEVEAKSQAEFYAAAVARHPDDEVRSAAIEEVASRRNATDAALTAFRKAEENTNE